MKKLNKRLIDKMIIRKYDDIYIPMLFILLIVCIMALVDSIYIKGYRIPLTHPTPIVMNK